MRDRDRANKNEIEIFVFTVTSNDFPHDMLLLTFSSNLGSKLWCRCSLGFPLMALSRYSLRSRPCLLSGVKRTSQFDRAMSASDPKRTSLHCSAFAPIIYLEGLRKPRETFWGSQASVNCAVIPLQRLNLLICSLFALCRWNQMPLGAFRHHVRVVVAASICLGVAATTRPSQKYNRATV